MPENTRMGILFTGEIKSQDSEKEGRVNAELFIRDGAWKVFQNLFASITFKFFTFGFAQSD